MPGPIQHPLQTYEVGDDWSIAWTLIDEYGAPLDPSGATAATWKLDDETGTTNYLSLTLGAGISIGVVPIWSVPAAIVTVSAAQTATILPGTYVDMFRMTLGGQTSTFGFGPIQVVRSL